MIYWLIGFVFFCMGAFSHFFVGDSDYSIAGLILANIWFARSSLK